MLEPEQRAVFRFLPKPLRHWLKNQLNLQIAANTTWLFADKILRLGIGLFLGVWIARYLGPNRFGQLSYALAFCALFGALANLGLDGIVIRDIVRNPKQKNEILGSAFVLKIIGGCLAFLVVMTCIVTVRPEDGPTQWLVGIIAFGMIFQAFDVADLWFQSQVQSKFTVISKNAAFLLLAVVKVWLILTMAEVQAFAWAATSEVLLGALGLYVAFRYVGNSWGSMHSHSARMASLLKESWPLLLSSFAIGIYMRTDQLMLAEMLGDRDVGLYSAALRLSEVWYLIPTILVSSMLPSLTKLHVNSKDLFCERLQRLFTLLTRLAYGIAIPMTIMATPLMILLLGEPFQDSGPVLAAHIWTAVFVFLGIGTTPWTMNERTMKISLYQTLFGAFSNIGLNLFFIPVYGALGAALASIVAQCFSAWFLNYLFKETRRLFWMQTNSIFMGLIDFKKKIT